ncbi:MAG: helix-turn-helix domain-containing protein [Gemmatimonas sp.]|jgi:putative zinc finger/helix-turn-helix YgiT family protein|nr:helix-turn-helix domain-containing protein [Gemmatimonas sp.]
MQDFKCPMCSSDNTTTAGASTQADSFTCAACGFEFSTFEQVAGAQRARVAQRALELGLFAPAEIKGIRDSYGLTQEQFERALGVGRKTVVRWERGTIPPSGAAHSLLWMAKFERTAFVALARKNGVDASPRTTVLPLPTSSERRNRVWLVMAGRRIESETIVPSATIEIRKRDDLLMSV